MQESIIDQIEAIFESFSESFSEDFESFEKHPVQFELCFYVNSGFIANAILLDQFVAKLIINHCKDVIPNLDVKVYRKEIINI